MKLRRIWHGSGCVHPRKPGHRGRTAVARRRYSAYSEPDSQPRDCRGGAQGKSARETNINNGKECHGRRERTKLTTSLLPTQDSGTLALGVNLRAFQVISNSSSAIVS